jgi:GT2 family glycosyltransferase
MATASVIIPLSNGQLSLETCLDAVHKNRAADEDLEVIVVGVGLRSGPAPSVERSPFKLRLVPRAMAGTFAQECNVGAGVASGEHLVLLDPGTTAQAGWLDVLLDHAAAHPSAAVIGSKLVDAGATVRHAGVVFGQDLYPRPLYAGFPFDHPAVNRSRRFQVVNLEGALIRRVAFERLGGFDTDFPGRFADVDLCLRLADCRYETHYCHRSVLFQANRSSRWSDTPSHEGFEPYRHRWAHRVEPDDLRYLIEDGLLTVRYGPDHGIQVAVSPMLEPKTEAPRDRAGEAHPAVSSRTLIELVTRTIDLSRQFQSLEARWRDRFNEFSGRLDEISRPSLDRKAPVADIARRGGDDLIAANGHGVGGTDTLERHTATNGVHISPSPSATSTSPAVTAPESVNGHRPQRTNYPQLRRRIREVVNATLPPDSVVVVVSRGDDDLLQLGSRRGWHFPQTEAGVYAGCYPADSGEAIAHLEEIRRKGGDYLLFPSTAFWWLGFYGEFHKHLESHYTCICNVPSCIIFQLSTAPGGGS